MEPQAASFDTPTLAELFAAQGMPARAVGIMRRVVRDRPEDLALKARLGELEAQLPPPLGGKQAWQQPLAAILQAVDGATAVALMDYAGTPMACAECGGGAVDVPRLLAEYAAATASLRHTGQEQPLAGSLTELTLFTTHLTVVLRGLTDDAYLAMVLSPQGLAGKARYLMRQAAPGLIAQLGRLSSAPAPA
jgi:predicted regulator of Ras-like GTPase activity (Roadblock/LC7/MglB family)